MACASGQWGVRASIASLNTHNLIRDVVEKIKVRPNPALKLISLSLGDPTAFGNLIPPPELFKAVHDIVDVNTSRSYGLTNGEKVAREAVAEYSAHQGPVTAEDVILTSGCAHALDLAITVLANPGQNILIPRPGYMIYVTLAQGLGIRTKHYDLLPNDNWKVDLQSLENGIDAETAAIVVLNPSNPCGSVYDREHLLQILAVAARNKVPIIADEIYEHFVFSGHEYTAISSLSNDVPILTCSGLTKRYLVPGWRLGWLIIHDRNNIFGQEIRMGLGNLCGRILGPNKLVQQALPSILKSIPDKFFKEVMSFIENQAHTACDMLRKAPGLRPVMPQGAMYMMIEIEIASFADLKNEIQFIEQLYAEQAVLCIPGQCFFYHNFMRIVLTVPEDILREACQRIVAFCEQHSTKRETLMEIDTNKLPYAMNSKVLGYSR